MWMYVICYINNSLAHWYLIVHDDYNVISHSLTDKHMDTYDIMPVTSNTH
jgi:hypothetical protein